MLAQAICRDNARLCHGCCARLLYHAPRLTLYVCPCLGRGRYASARHLHTAIRTSQRTGRVGASRLGQIEAHVQGVQRQARGGGLDKAYGDPSVHTAAGCVEEGDDSANESSLQGHDDANEGDGSRHDRAGHVPGRKVRGQGHWHGRAAGFQCSPQTYGGAVEMMLADRVVDTMNLICLMRRYLSIRLCTWERCLCVGDDGSETLVRRVGARPRPKERVAASFSPQLPAIASFLSGATASSTRHIINRPPAFSARLSLQKSSLPWISTRRPRRHHRSRAPPWTSRPTPSLSANILPSPPSRARRPPSFPAMTLANPSM